MAHIFIDLDAKATDPAAVAAEIAAITQALPNITLKVDMDGDDVILEGEYVITEWKAQRDPSLPEPPVTRVVQVRGQYTYTLYVDDHGDVRVGGTVDVEARAGGHWTGKVTKVWPSVEDYLKDEGAEEPPSLIVLEVIDPGPQE